MLHPANWLNYQKFGVWLSLLINTLIFTYKHTHKHTCTHTHTQMIIVTGPAAYIKRWCTQNIRHHLPSRLNELVAMSSERGVGKDLN